MQRAVTAIFALVLTVGGWFAIPVTTAGSGIATSAIEWIAKTKPKQAAAVKSGLTAGVRSDRGFSPTAPWGSTGWSADPPRCTIARVAEYRSPAVRSTTPSCIFPRPPPQQQA